jgi:DNA-binding SARP family transcriptional activator
MSIPTCVVPRAALIARVARVRPRILSVIAPAGYGKSAFVRELLATEPAAATVDLTAVGDEADFAGRLVASLVGLKPDERGALAAEAAWAESAGDVVVFESAQALGASPPCREFLSRLLARMPAGRRAIIVSREALRLPLTRYAAPHELLAVRAADLAFGAPELEALFAEFALEGGVTLRVLEATWGWPACVLLARRLAAEGRLDPAAERLEDALALELREYVAHEITAQLDARTAEAIAVCAMLPDADVYDIRAAFADPEIGNDLRALAAEWPFLASDERGAFSLHPVIARLARERAGDGRATLVREIAQTHERRGDMVRAAELFLETGDVAEGARALGRHEVIRDARPSVRYRRALSRIDRVTVARIPRLWGLTALTRLFREPADAMLDEAETIWRTLPISTTAIERAYVFAVRTLCMTYLGAADEALRQIEQHFPPDSLAGRPDVEGLVLHLRGVVNARRGALSIAERELNAALVHAHDADARAASILVALGADVARIRGEGALERQFIERGRQRAHASGLMNVAAHATAELLVAEWMAGNAREVVRRAEELDTLVAEYGAGAFGFLAGVALGRNVEPARTDLPRFASYGRMMQLARSYDGPRRAELARSALAFARSAGAPALEALAGVALAVADESQASAGLGIALAAAQRVDSPPLADAIQALAAGKADAGMLAPLVVAVKRGGSAALCEIRVLAGSVRVDGLTIRLPAREMECLAALAVRPEAVPRARLASMVWPDLDEAAARNALSVCMHRLRGRLGRDDIIVRESGDYRLHESAIVDLWEIDRAASLARSRDLLTESDRLAFERALTLLQRSDPEQFDRWEWFAPVLRRLAGLRIELAHRLSMDALDRGDVACALEHADAIIAEDPCDEGAREIAMLAHLRAGDRAAAVRHYRHYRDALREELGVEPSSKLAALVAE